MLSAFKDVHPLMGDDPMLKAFIVIVLAGLGNITGALYAALLVGFVEATVKVLWADKYGFTAIQTGRTLLLKDIFPETEGGYTLGTPSLSR